MVRSHPPPGLPVSTACENNKGPILDVLRGELARVSHVLEIGSGTGQHAAWFAPRLPHLVWQTSDLPENHAGIRGWLAASGAANARAPVVLDVTAARWPIESCGAVYSANTAHIMHWPAVERMFAGVARVLEADGTFILYGPFSYGGCHVSESNARFDASLKARDPAMGVRDFDAVRALAHEHGLDLRADHEMPANNRILVWRRRAPAG